MEISANFEFLKQEFPFAAEGASYAERHVYSDPRASCFHARHALERLIMRVYKVDKTLNPPKITNLDGYMNEPTFRQLIPEVVWQKAEFVRKAGNVAVHGRKNPTPETALNMIRELSHVLYWAGRTYLRKGAENLGGFSYDESLIPKVDPLANPASLEELNALNKKLEAAEAARIEAEIELKQLREQFAVNKVENEAVPETHDWNEADTRKRIIDLDLLRAGWVLDQPQDQEFEVSGMPNKTGKGFVDYVLWGDDGKPLGLVEAKKTTHDPEKGQQQAKLYADCLESAYGQRPIIFYTNGYKTHIWDDFLYPPREVAGYYTKDELATLIQRRSLREPVDASHVRDSITDRYYQKRAISSIGEHFSKSFRKALLVMATGTGKTRTAIALVDLLQRAGWVKRVLFLADRRALVKQARNAFKLHLPQSNPVNLVDEKEAEGRVYLSTYPTMMGLIDEDDENGARFGVGHFDLVIIDEAHRSVYQKYGAIFEYFDSLLIGLTATPRDDIDKNTYDLFDLEAGIPTDAYELETAVADDFLVPPKVQQVDLKFPREGIDYESLSEEEKEQWESLDWGDDVEPGELPERVNASAINDWLFNRDTVDKVLKHLMEHGHKVAGGDRLAKTIIFARNHKHAKFIEKRFNNHYPQYAGQFARVIDNYEDYAETLIDDFSQRDKIPHIAISVDMLDTGIDIPEIANLVFFKPVYSKIKFWQMIGRGTRLCPDLFGPGEDKEDFRVFDFCFNFDFFRETPEGITSSVSVPLSAKLFSTRVELLKQLQDHPELDEATELIEALKSKLHTEVSSMNRDNFIVRMHLEPVDKFRNHEAWDKLSNVDLRVLHNELSGLPTEIPLEDVEIRLFDRKVLAIQLALCRGEIGLLTNFQTQITEIAEQLEGKRSIPAITKQQEYLARLQTNEFWQDVDLHKLEELRLRVRELVPFIDKKKRHIIYTDFKDEVMGVRDESLLHIPKMTSKQYERKVREFLLSHLHEPAINRLRNNHPLSKSDLDELEAILVKIGEEDGNVLLTGLVTQKNATSLAYFVRTLIGLDRAAAKMMFSDFLNNRSLTSSQIRFIEMVIDQLTIRGVMDASALYEQPFTRIHSGGPDALFSGQEEILEALLEKIDEVKAGLSAQN